MFRANAGLKLHPLRYEFLSLASLEVTAFLTTCNTVIQDHNCNDSYLFIFINYLHGFNSLDSRILIGYGIEMLLRVDTVNNILKITSCRFFINC